MQRRRRMGGGSILNAKKNIVKIVYESRVGTHALQLLLYNPRTHKLYYTRPYELARWQGGANRVRCKYENANLVPILIFGIFPCDIITEINAGEGNYISYFYRKVETLQLAEDKSRLPPSPSPHHAHRVQYYNTKRNVCAQAQFYLTFTN